MWGKKKPFGLGSPVRCQSWPSVQGSSGVERGERKERGTHKKLVSDLSTSYLSLFIC